MANDQTDGPSSEDEMEAAAKRIQNQINYFGKLQQAALANGFVILEAWRCVQCKNDNLYSHCGVETVPCMTCGHRHATTGPRPPGKDEIGVIHYIMAEKMLRDVYAERATELPPLAEHEILALCPEMRTILARHRTMIVSETAKKLGNLAEELAGIDA